MPVDIRKLVIMVHVADDSKVKPVTGNGMPNTPNSTSLNDDTKQQLIEETVQQVLEILQRQKDR